MRVFVAGGTGAIGRPLLERLRAEGHEATVMTRSAERAAELGARGLDAVVADAFDAEAVHAAVAAARPEVVIHELRARDFFSSAGSEDWRARSRTGRDDR